MTAPAINGERLLADLDTLAQFGGRSDGGVDRIDGSPADRDARRWLADRMSEAGLEPVIDEHWNLVGTPAGSQGPWLMLGSHTDTVPAGGRLDGAYGVIAALEVARALRDTGRPAVRSVKVVSFAGEEGIHGHGLRGSRAFCAAGGTEGLAGYLELHIEQGARLWTAGLDAAVVTGIVGIRRWEVTFTGAANHAGTTPFALRRDAGRAAARFLAELPDQVSSIDAEMVANVGQIDLEPGAVNVVPGVARFVLEMRCIRSASLQVGAEGVAGWAAAAATCERCEVSLTPLVVDAPVEMDGRLQRLLAEACDEVGVRHTSFASGAGHDAQELGRRVPAGMLFVPSRDGLSHSPREHTPPEQLIAGARVLLNCVLRAAPDSSAAVDK